jgi:hypothetical protein
MVTIPLFQLIQTEQQRLPGLPQADLGLSALPDILPQQRKCFRNRLGLLLSRASGGGIPAW